MTGIFWERKFWIQRVRSTESSLCTSSFFRKASKPMSMPHALHRSTTVSSFGHEIPRSMLLIHLSLIPHNSARALGSNVCSLDSCEPVRRNLHDKTNFSPHSYILSDIRVKQQEAYFLTEDFTGYPLNITISDVWCMSIIVD